MFKCAPDPTPTRKWKLLFHGKLVTPKYSKAEIARLTNAISSTIRCRLPIHTQLRFLTTAQKNLSGPARNRCYQKVALRIKRLTGLTLPNIVPLCVPCLRGMDKLDLLPLLKETIGGLPIPVYYRTYLKSVYLWYVIHVSQTCYPIESSLKLPRLRD